METKTEVINLKDGYYIKRWNRFDGDKLLFTKEKHYDNWGRVVYGKEYVDGKIVHEQWRWYHNNGELAGIRDSKGFEQKFNELGLPIK